jgi:hypothetical protein
MPICRMIKISDHTAKCWSGESPAHSWAAVSRAPEFGSELHDVITMQERGATSDRWHNRQVWHNVTSSVVCHSLFVTSQNSGALETAQQSKGMQRYHEFCLKIALKLLILGWVVVMINIKPRSCLVLVTRLHSLRSLAFKAGGNKLVRSGNSDQTLVRFSYCNSA